MKQVLKIPFKLPSFNDYNNICRRNKWEANNFKKGVQGDIVWAIKKSKLLKCYKAVKVNFIWIERTKKRDIDNVMSAKKFILDALVTANILINDSPKYVCEITDKLIYDKNKGDMVLVEIEEVENE